MSLSKRKKRSPNERRRTKPPTPEEKPDYPAAIALARNVAEIQSRIGQSKRQETAHKLESARLEAQREALMKVTEELAEAGEFDMDTFRSILLRELEDVGIVASLSAEDEEDDDQE
jgi:hypothetical protein